MYVCIHMCVCIHVCVWVYVLSKSIIPFQHYSEGVPSATNAVPYQGVNNLIFNAAVHYAEERSHMYHQHPLSVGQSERERIRRGKWR